MYAIRSYYEPVPLYLPLVDDPLSLAYGSLDGLGLNELNLEQYTQLRFRNNFV